MQACFPSGSCNAFGSYGFDDVATRGGYNATLTGNSTANIDAQCATLCITKAGANFFGTVNSATGSTGDCYCGSAITGSASILTNCVPCNGQTIGLCGKNGTSIAVYARAF